MRLVSVIGSWRDWVRHSETLIMCELRGPLGSLVWARHLLCTGIRGTHPRYQPAELGSQICHAEHLTAFSACCGPSAEGSRVLGPVQLITETLAAFQFSIGSASSAHHCFRLKFIHSLKESSWWKTSGVRDEVWHSIFADGWSRGLLSECCFWTRCSSFEVCFRGFSCIGGACWCTCMVCMTCSM